MEGALQGIKELFQIADRLQTIRDSELLAKHEVHLEALTDAATSVGRAFSGSWLGYHSTVYYRDLAPSPPGAHFSQEWGLKDLYGSSLGSTGDWVEFSPEEVIENIMKQAGSPNIIDILKESDELTKAFKSAKSDICSIILTENTADDDQFLGQLLSGLDSLEPMTVYDIAQEWSPKGQIMTRDTTAAGQGTKIPPHIKIKAQVASIRQAFNICAEAGEIARKAASHLERKKTNVVRNERIGTNIFIGHGRSLVWRELKDFVETRLHLPWDEFNRVPVAGFTNIARLSEMLDAAAFAFLIMTAEDEMAEGETQARMNVIHEVGLFQGRLGFERAIVLLEEGCAEFSNVQGLGQIRFPKDNIAAAFEDVRRVLEREKLVPEG